MLRITLLRSLLALCLGIMLVAPTFAQRQPSASTTVPQAAGDEFWDDRFVMPGTKETVYDIAEAADGTVYAKLFDNTVMRWDGRTWQKIGEAFGIKAIATIENTLYAAGSFDKIGAFPVKYLAKWTGSAWAQVGSGKGPEVVMESSSDDGSFDALAVLNGKLYVGGTFNRVDNTPANSIAVWNGSSWSALGAGVRSLDFEAQPTEPGKVEVIRPTAGKLYVGGKFEVAGTQKSNSIAVWDGGSWSTFGAGMAQEENGHTEPGTVRAIAVSGNTVYAGGEFNKAGSTDANNIAAWEGDTWTTLGSGLTADCCVQVNALLVVGDDLLAGGDFTSAGGAAINDFARWTGGTWHPAAQLHKESYVKSLVATANGYYIGGDIDKLDANLVENIALRAGETWQPLGLGLTLGDGNCCSGTVRAVANDSAGHVYVGGRFKRAGGLVVNNIAMWDGTRWHPLGAGVGEGQVYALLLLGDDLYVGGDFKSAGGAAIQYLAKWNTTTGEWSSLGSGVNHDVYALEYVDGVLYAGGDMSAAGGVAVSNIAAWDGEGWSALSEKLVIRQIFDNCSEAGSQVYAIKASGRYLAIGGAFSQVQIGFDKPCAKESYFPANNILLWDRLTDEWFFLGGNGQYGVTGGDAYRNKVKALEVAGGALSAGGALYVGGEFGQAGPVPAAGLARFKLQGGWESFGGVSGGSTGFLTYPGVAALEAVGSDLYVGGNFDKAGTGPAKYVARYNFVAGTWAALGSGLDDEVFAVGPALDGLYVGGKFTQAGGHLAAGFSHWAVEIPGANETPTPVVEPTTPTATTDPTGPTATTNPSGPTATTNPSGPTATTNPGGPTATTNPGGPTATATTQPNGTRYRVYLPVVQR